MKEFASCKYSWCWRATPRSNGTRFPTILIKPIPPVVWLIRMGTVGVGVAWFRYNTSTRFLQGELEDLYAS
jgi:hypothetical protein